MPIYPDGLRDEDVDEMASDDSDVLEVDSDRNALNYNEASPTTGF